MMPIRTLCLVMLMSGLLGAEDEVPGLPHLRGWLTGSFSSARQAAADSDYYDIRLRMVPIWKEREDGPWLYVEQAMAQAQDQPYRQRVYRLRQESPTTFVSEVWQLPAPERRFAGAWRNDSLLAGLDPSALEERAGCAVHLTWHPGQGVYAGGTQGEGCASTLRGAAYATSEVSITGEGLGTWDRGYDEEGRQAWGAHKGGYDFRRLVPVIQEPAAPVSVHP
ncbi:MAG: chromophore lyase CpcT/CpeT [bacterium]|jgi:hypothetical protein|nr:chromophore lyase CpcT/CpeT [bacterium]